MRICVLGSGSKGNCTFVETEHSKILIDAGLSNKEIEARLELIKVNPNDIDAILLTHEHSDHIKGVGQFVKKHGAKVFANKKSWNFVLSKFEDLPFEKQFEFCGGQDFLLNDVAIQTFDVDHDSLSCVGFSVIEGNKMFTIATDLGHVTPNIVKRLGQSDFAVLESNHDVEMLKHNPNYPLTLKQRILSDHGHISNSTCADTILQMLGLKTRGILLGHLSEHNNTPELALNTLKNKLENNNIKRDEVFYVDVASQEKPSNIYRIKDL